MAAPRTPPGPKPRFSRDDIVEAGLAILATEGLAHLSLRRLAAEVGVTAAALYGYFGSKDDLEAALVAKVMPTPPGPDLDPDRPWNEQLRDYLLDIHDAIVRHPGIAQLFISRAADYAATNQIREHLLRLLFAGGFTGDDAVSALGTVSRYVLGSVAIADSQRRVGPPGVDQPAPSPSSKYPLLQSLSASYSVRNSPEVTRYGLDATILGLQAMARLAPAARANPPQ